MSSKVLEPGLVNSEALAGPAALPVGRVRPSRAALAPAAAAIVALLVDQLLPNRQVAAMSWLDGLPRWQHPYPVLLAALLAASLLAGVLQLAWRGLRAWIAHHAPLVAGAIGLACAFEIVTAKLAWLPQPFFPAPDEVLGALIEDRALLAESTGRSLLLLLGGYCLGVMAGIVTGVLIGWFPRARYWGMPVIKLIGPIPATAVVALALTLFASLFHAAVFLIALAVWFPVTMLTSSGIRNVPRSYIDVARTLGAGRTFLIFRVALPAALPNIFLGLFMGLCTSFLTLIVAETVGVKAGLGWYLQWQKGYAEYGKVYAALLIMACFFSTIMTLLFRLRDRVLSWQKGVIQW